MVVKTAGGLGGLSAHLAVNRHESILALNGHFALDLSCGDGRSHQLRETIRSELVSGSFAGIDGDDAAGAADG